MEFIMGVLVTLLVITSIVSMYLKSQEEAFEEKWREAIRKGMYELEGRIKNLEKNG